ncbi:MAG: FG-GAP repeat domain-containing protein [Planctomycetota bacterium]|jgi:hypothetical protein
MKDFILRLSRRIIPVVFAIAILGNGSLSCTELRKRQPNPSPEYVNSKTNDNDSDISAYYGFDEMEIIKLEWGIKGLRICDFDRDGRNDIAVVNNKKAKVELLIQKEDVGPDETGEVVDPEGADINQLSPPTRFARQSVAVSQRIFSFACADLNSDKMVDLAFYGEPKGLYVILQKNGEAKGEKPKSLSWRTQRRIEIDDGLTSSNALVCGDLNNDGAADLALAGRDAVYVVLQKEDGSLAEPVKYATTGQTLGMKIGDLNGDKINDLVLITSDNEKPMHVRLGLKTGQLGPQVRFFIEKPYALKLYDLDGQTGEEVLTVDALSGRLTGYKFGAEKEHDVDWPVLFYPLSLDKEAANRDLAVGDFDGDGLPDVAVSEPGAAEIVLYRQIPALGLTEPVRFPAFADIAGLSVADIDEDGKAELAVLSVKEKVIGLSKFENDRLSFPKPIDLTGEPLAMELADVDHDDSADCVYVSKDANDVRYLRVIYNSGKASKGEGDLNGLLAEWKEGVENESVLELKKVTSNPSGLKVLDVDQDGLADVLIFVKYDAPILVRQIGKSKFAIVDSPKSQASLIKAASPSSISVADVDDRRGMELLLAQNNFARSLVFDDGKSWRIIDQYNAKSPENRISSVAAFDIEGKGSRARPAILLLDGQKGRLQILKAGDDKTYRFDKEIDVSKWSAASHLKMLFAPLTGNGAQSILLFDSEKFALITPPSDNKVPPYLEKQFSYETRIKDGSYGNLAAGDINLDRRADIIMVEYKRNHVEILALDSEMQPIPAMRFKVFEQKSYRDDKRGRGHVSVEPRELIIADVTNDGREDLVTVIHDRIIIYPQD